jgi:hypothetical protein
MKEMISKTAVGYSNMNNELKKLIESKRSHQKERLVWRNNMSDYKKSIVWTVIWLIVFFPVGIYRMWNKGQFNKNVRVGLTVFFILPNIIGLLWSSNLIPKKKKEIIEE